MDALQRAGAGGGKRLGGGREGVGLARRAKGRSYPSSSTSSRSPRLLRASPPSRGPPSVRRGYADGNRHLASNRRHDPGGAPRDHRATNPGQARLRFADPRPPRGDDGCVTQAVGPVESQRAPGHLALRDTADPHITRSAVADEPSRAGRVRLESGAQEDYGGGSKFTRENASALDSGAAPEDPRAGPT